MVKTNIQLVGIYYILIALCLLVLIQNTGWAFLYGGVVAMVSFGTLRVFGSTYPWRQS